MQLQWKLKKTVQKAGDNSEDLCITNSQQYLCIVQLTFCSEARPTADVSMRWGGTHRIKRPEV